METNKPTLKVTILRGASEIGGNLVEVEKLLIGHKIYLDCGLPLFKPHSQEPMAFDLAKYSRWADMDPEAAMKAKRSLGILPAQDSGLFFDEGWQKNSGVFISHAHQDHWGLLPFIYPYRNLQWGSK